MDLRVPMALLVVLALSMAVQTSAWGKRPVVVSRKFKVSTMIARRRLVSGKLSVLRVSTLFLSFF
jgi:hypothetical protein